MLGNVQALPWPGEPSTASFLARVTVDEYRRRSEMVVDLLGFEDQAMCLVTGPEPGSEPTVERFASQELVLRLGKRIGLPGLQAATSASYSTLDESADSGPETVDRRVTISMVATAGTTGLLQWLVDAADTWWAATPVGRSSNAQGAVLKVNTDVVWMQLGEMACRTGWSHAGQQYLPSEISEVLPDRD